MAVSRLRGVFSNLVLSPLEGRAASTEPCFDKLSTRALVPYASSANV
jgi:hypothetical protein